MLTKHGFCWHSHCLKIFNDVPAESTAMDIGLPLWPFETGKVGVVCVTQ